MSRGFVHNFQVIAPTGASPLVDAEGRWESPAKTQNVRGRLGFDAEMLKDVTNPDTLDLVALVPVNTLLGSPAIVRVPPGLEAVAAPGDYLVQQRQRLRFHIRLGCVRTHQDPA